MPMQDAMLAFSIDWTRIQNDLLMWLPILFFGVIIWLLWKTIGMMPRVKPTSIQPKSSSPGLPMWKPTAPINA